MLGVWLALAGTVILVFADTLKKIFCQSNSVLVVAWTMVASATTVNAIYVLAGDLPSIKWAVVFPTALVSGVLYTLGELLFLRALRLGDLSLTLPLRVVGPLVALPLGVLLFGETPGIGALAAIVLIVLGAYLLYLPRGGKYGPWGPLAAISRDPAARAMMASAVLFPLIVSLQRIGATESSPEAHFALSLGAQLLCLTVLVLREYQAVVAFVGARPTLVLFGGTLWGVGMALTVISVQFTFVAYTSVVMQLSPLLAMPVAAIVFKERVGTRVLPVALMVLGVCLLVISNQPTGH